MFNLTPMVKNILIINVAVHLILTVLGGLGDKLSEMGSVYYLFSDHFFIFQFVTYMWLHGGFMHLLFNMIGLIVFGPMLEQVWGYKKFLIYYLIVGIGAGLFYGGTDIIQNRDLEADTEAYYADPSSEKFYQYVYKHKSRNFNLEALDEFAYQYEDNPGNSTLKEKSISRVKEIHFTLTERHSMLGASGAIMGILLAFGMLFPNRELMLLIPPMPIKAKYLVFLYGVYQVYKAINPTQGDNVSYLTHIGGLIVGFIVLKYWQHKHGSFY